MKRPRFGTLLPLSILPLVLFSSCATIMHGTSQKVGISSYPTNAKVTIDNKEFGVTPLFADLSRKDAHIVRVELEGYQKAELTLTRSVSGWVWGNIVFGGLIGLAVDAISGGLYKLSPEQLNAEMRKDGMGSLQNDDAELHLLTVLKPDPTWHRIGQLEPVAH